MIDPNELDDDVLSCIMSNLGIKDPEDPRIASLSVEEALNAYLTWNGIIGYSTLFLRAFKNIISAGIKDTTLTVSAEDIAIAVQLAEVAKSNPNALLLAVQLLGVEPCKACGYRKKFCRC